MCRQIAVLPAAAVIALAIGSASVAHASSRCFIENRGQVNEAVRYYLPASDAAVYFTPQALVIDLKEHVTSPTDELGPGNHRLDPRAEEDKATRETRRGCAVYIRFDGGSPAPAIVARGQLETQYNYFLGNDPATWRSQIPTYEKVVYRDVWPGIDLIFHSNSSALAYEIVTRPGVDAGIVSFSYEGIQARRLIDAESEALDTPLGSVVHRRHVLGGEFRRLAAGNSSVTGSTDVPPDDPTALLFSTFLGGAANDDNGFILALDATGNVLVTGITASLDFPTTPGGYDISPNGSQDAFVVKLSASGNVLLWGTFLGGTSDDRGRSITLDTSGDPVVMGVTYSENFPTTPGAFDRSLGGTSDVFVAKLSSAGSALSWSTLLGGRDSELGDGLCLDHSGNVLVNGTTYSDNFPTTVGAYDRYWNGGYADAFVSKISAAGDALIWSTYLGGSNRDYGAFAICLDFLENPVVVGNTLSTNFPTTPSAYDRSLGGIQNAYVAKLSAAGSSLIWSTYLGGDYADYAYSLALDAAGNPVVTGFTQSTDFPTTPGAYDRVFAGFSECFVTKLAASGSALKWSTFLGGVSRDDGHCVALDPSGMVLVAGETYSADFPTTPGAFDTSYNGAQDGFVANISPTGSRLVWSTFLGGGQEDHGYALALDAFGRIVVTGRTLSADFPTTAGAFDPSYGGGTDVYVAKLRIPLIRTVVENSYGRAGASLSNEPNPFVAGTIIRYTLHREAEVRLGIYDIGGRLVSLLDSGRRSPGSHSAAWDGLNAPGGHVATGIYFLRLAVGDEVVERRVVRIR